MKKIVIIIAVLVVAGLIGGTYYSSRQTERFFTTQMEKTRELYGPMLVTSLDEYNKGYLESSAKTSVQMGDLFNLHLLHRIKHLPWGAKIVTTVDRGAYAPEDLAEVEKMLPLDEVRVITRIGLTGSSRVRMEVPDVNVQEDDGQFLVSGIELNGTLNAAMDAGDYDVRLGRLQAKTPDKENISFEGLRYAGTYRYQDGLPLGKANLSLDKVRASEADVVNFSLNNLVCKVNTTLKDKTMNQYADLSFGDMTVSGESCSDGRLKYEITGLDADGMREMQDVYRSLSADILASREPDPFLLQMQIMSKAWQMLQKGVHLKLETLEVQSAAGGINLQGYVDFAAADPQTGLGFDVNNVHAEATLQMDEGTLAYGYRLSTTMKGQQLSEEELARQSDAFLRSLLAQNILVKRDGGGLKAEFSFVDGQGRLNGNPLPR